MMGKLYKWLYKRYKLIAWLEIALLVVLVLSSIVYFIDAFSFPDPDYLQKAIEYPNLYPVEEAPIVINKFFLFACYTIGLYLIFSATTLLLILMKDETKTIEPSTKTLERGTNEVMLLESFVANHAQIKNIGNWYKAGTYKAGINIPAGVFILQNNNPKDEALATVYADSQKKETLCCTKFKTFHYITLLNGQCLKTINAKCAERALISRDYNTNDLEGGMYRVGTDIPAGTYRLQGSSDASYTIFNNASAERNPVSALKFSGETFVSVIDGCYILLEDCKAEIQL